MERGATAPLGGRIADITLASPGLPLVQNAAHTAFGRLQRWTDAAGKVQTRSHNLDGQVVAYSAGGQTWQLTYDSAGRLTRIADSANPVLAADYGYDAVNRLTRAVLPNTAYAYAYDANGNRKQSTIGGQVQSLSIDPASNRLLALASSPPIAYTYDPAGNRSTDGQTNYTYDAAGRLVQATSALGSTRYQVNALNQRTRKTGPQGDTTYLHDRQGHLLAETDSQGRIQREYVWLDDQLLAILDGDPSATQIYAVHPDPLGTPRAVTDPTGKLVWRAAPASEPFGLSVEQDPDGDGTPFVLNLRFPGQYFDKETNLAYNWHRYYDERVGGYTTSDPIGLKGGQWSTYQYVDGNPLLSSDSSGLFDDGRRLGPARDPDGPLGHSDFEGGDTFDFTREDHGWRHPYNPFSTWRHFRSLRDAEREVEQAIANCDKEMFESRMHQAQDSFSHYDRGFRWTIPQPPTRNPIVGFNGYPGVIEPIQCGGLGHGCAGHAPDKDEVAWRSANEFTKKLVNKFKEKCQCKS